MEIKPVEPFEATMDFSRNNAERKPWGKAVTTDQFHLGSEYDTPPMTEESPGVV